MKIYIFACVSMLSFEVSVLLSCLSSKKICSDQLHIIDHVEVQIFPPETLKCRFFIQSLKCRFFHVEVQVEVQIFHPVVLCKETSGLSPHLFLIEHNSRLQYE